ncbi:MAG TPA: sulfatase-like hydrolase/transferase [Caldilineae bacterium]|nr:sulfatase-like hydrolase/transferase [Caldilineae bacterium]
MTSPSTHPNILLIHTDEHRWDCLGPYGNSQIRTPHLDRLAADAVRFDNCFCPYPVCTPSRYSLLTGLYVRQHLGWTNHSTLAPGFETFPRLLRQAGYRTKAVGKMHFTPTYLDVGFEEMELAEQDGDGRLDDDYHRELMAHGLIDAIDLIDQRAEFRRRAPASYWETFGAQPSDLPEEWHSTTWIADRAMRALEEWTDSGNLLMVGFIKPHHPFDPPEPWIRMYDPKEIDPLPGWLDVEPERDRAYHAGYFPNHELTEATIRRITAYYYATISHIDHHIGRMIELLKRKGLYDDTMIIFTSDHGDYMGFHHMILKGGHMYDPLMRVPLLIKFPGNQGAGTTRDTLVSLIDLAPTILRQAHIEPPACMRGLDLADPTADRPMIFAENRRGQVYMARSRTHKLILSHDPDQCLFFDLDRDPLELTDHFQDPTYQPLIREHCEALARWLMFDAVPPTYLDERAPCIDQPNVPDPDDDHRQRMLAYFERKIAG